MAAIAQKHLFSWDAIEARSDLDRLRLAIDHLPDERLVQYLEVMRGHGRDDYPVRAMWHALLAGIVFQHESPESLLRELARNPSLMGACGFDPLPRQGKPKPRIVTDPATGVARIEVPTEEISRLADDGLRERLLDGIRASGFRFVTVDLAGYARGSSNPEAMGS